MRTNDHIADLQISAVEAHAHSSHKVTKDHMVGVSMLPGIGAPDALYASVMHILIHLASNNLDILIPCHFRKKGKTRSLLINLVHLIAATKEDDLQSGGRRGRG